MQCPNDGAVLVMSERSGIEIDDCPTCRGVWLDRGELDKIVDRACYLIDGGYAALSAAPAAISRCILRPTPAPPNRRPPTVSAPTTTATAAAPSTGGSC